MAHFIELDLKDKKILSVLSQNARYSTSTVAKLTGLSREVVNYRIKKLIADGVITKFTLALHPYFLGYEKYSLYLKLQGCTIDEEIRILQDIVKFKEVIWVSRNIGQFDYVIELYVKKAAELSDKLFQILEILGDKVNTYQITREYDYSFFGYKFLQDLHFSAKTNDKLSFSSEFAKPKISLVQIDDLDKRIVNLLSWNCRATITEMAQKLKSDPKTIISRIKKLIRGGVILHFFADLNFFRINYLWYGIHLQLKNTKKEVLLRLEEYLRVCKEAPWVVRTIGSADFVFSIFVKTPDEFVSFLDRFKTEFKDNILDLRFAQIIQELVYDAHLT